MDRDVLMQLVSDALEGIVVTDPEGTILFANRTAENLLGYSQDSLKGQFAGCLFPSHSTAHLLPNLMKVALDLGRFNGEILLETSAGSPVMVRLTAVSFPQPPPGVLIFRFLDWREVQDLIKQVKEAGQMAVLGNLTRSMSHEILNPISVIGAFTKRLVEEMPLSSRHAEWGRQILNNVEKLEFLIQTVNNFIHLPPPRFQAGSPSGIVGAVVMEMGQDLKAQGIQVREKGLGKPGRIHLDPAMFRQAVTAVILNAVNRMPKGGTLTVTCRTEPGGVAVQVEDTGPTLDTRKMEEDMSPLHVVVNHRSNLNLATARRIIDEHGGRFSFGISERGGLKVDFAIPADRRALSRNRPL